MTEKSRLVGKAADATRARQEAEKAKFTGELKGTLLREHAPRKLEVGTVIIQRDSGDDHEVITMVEGQPIRLKNLKNGAVVTKSGADLYEKLNTPGSAWRWKE